MSICCLSGWMFLLASLTAQAHPADPITDELAELQTWADQARNEANVPAIFAGVISGDQPGWIVASGIRKTGDETPVTPQDLIHLGSCTKALTSLLMARLVDRGIVKWDEALQEQAPELARQIHADYAQVTLRQLLSHRGGVPANARNWWLKSREPEINKTRLQVAADSLSQRPTKAVGSQYQYSNLGYMLAALIATEKTGISWEELIRQEVFQPLGFTTAGFGHPGQKDDVDQPWGHQKQTGKDTWKASQSDNAPALGPAGTVHMSPQDWVKIAKLFYDGPQADYLSKDQFDALTQSQGDNYALGWIVVQRPWARGTAITHSGSNTHWYCTIWIAPKTRCAYFAATNCSNEKIPEVVDGWIGELIDWERQRAAK